MADRTYRASKHYVWRLTDTLGQGAFGSVFKGIHKVTGGLVAVKVFNRNYATLNQKVREFEILQGLSHPNVVKLLAIEEEISSLTQSTDRSVVGPSVMVMELCEAGSLYCTLDRPENSFGLSENEFLLVLKHLTAGVKYLRQCEIIHRDYKPSNILKSFDTDGSVIYKLCDFGAARILKDGEQHMSIVGTEEYLRDDIHKTAFFNGTQKCFPPTSDLWSLGATLFQLATGQLPFRPYNGRSNKEKMQSIVSQKPPGVICGYQLGPDGKIIYEKQLPKDCRFSSGLRPLVEVLLAGLLKNASETSWSFDEFFQTVEDILNRRRMEIFLFHEASFISVYLSQGLPSPANELIREIQLQTHLSPAEQCIITFDGRHVSDAVITELGTGRQLGKLTDSDAVKPDFCLFAMPVTPIPVKTFSARKLPHSPIFNEVTSVEYDCELAKQCAMLTCWMHRELEKVVLSNKCLRSSMTALKVAVEQRYTLCEQKATSAKTWWDLLQRNLSLLDKCNSLQTAMGTKNVEKMVELKKTIDKKTESGSEICRLMDRIQADLTALQKHIFMGQQNQRISEDDASPELEAKSENELDFIQQQVSGTVEILNVFKRDKAMRIQEEESRFFNEVQWHKLMKKQLLMRWDSIKPRLNGQSVETLQRTQSNLQKSHESFLMCLTFESRLEEQTDMLQEMLAAYDNALSQTVDNFQLSVAAATNEPSAAVAVLPAMPVASITNRANHLSSDVKTARRSNPQLDNGLLNVMQMARELRELIDQNVVLSESLQTVSLE